MASEVSADIRTAAQMTTTFSLMYGATFINVLANKRRGLNMARAANKEFDRYSSPVMRKADRLQANFLEWSPVYMGLLWSLAATNNLEPSTVAASWGYIGLRALYVVLTLKFGVKSNGMNKALWASTFPAYGCLTYMGARAVALLFF